MPKFRKLTAILLSAVMLVCCFAVNAGAESIEDTAKSITNGKTYTKQMSNSSKSLDYKVNINKAGTLKIDFISYLYSFEVYLFDSSGIAIYPSEISTTTGYAAYYKPGYTRCFEDEIVEKCTGKINYEVKKGTYYIRFSNFWINGKLSYKVTLPSSSSAKLTGIAYPLKTGDTLKLSASTSSKTTDTVTWSSSDKDVAVISSSGKVTAKGKGTATITAKLGTSSASIVIQVS